MKKQNLLSAFDALLGPRIADKIPEGFYTPDQIADERGEDRKYMAQRLRELAAMKKVTRQKFRNDDGRVCWFYGVSK